MGQTCKELQRLTSSKTLWKVLCKSRWMRSYWGAKSSAYKALDESVLNDWRKIYATRTKVDSRWKRGDARVVTLSGHHRGINAVVFDDAKLVSGGEDGLVVVWDIRSGEAVRVHPFEDLVTALDYGADGVAVVALWSGAVYMVDLDSGASLGLLGGHTTGVRALQASEDVVVTGDFSGQLRVFDRRTGACCAALSAHGAGITDLAFLGDVLVTAAYDGAIHLYTGLRSAKGALQLRAKLRCACASPPASMWAVGISEEYIAAGCEEGRIHLWDSITLAPHGTIDAHADRISSLALDGKRVVSGSDDGSVRVWAAETGEAEAAFAMGREHPVSAVRFDDTKCVVAGGEADPTLRIFDFAYNLDACDARSRIMALPSSSATLQISKAVAAGSSRPEPSSCDMVFSDSDADSDDVDADRDCDNSLLLQDMGVGPYGSDSDDSDDGDMMAIIEGRF